MVRELRLALADGVEVAAALHVPDPAAGGPRTPVLLLPGARGDASAAHLVALADVLAAAGHPVVRSALTPRPPGQGVVGTTAAAVARCRHVLAAARALVAEHVDGVGADAGWIVGGASYGGRVASLTVADGGGAAIGAVGLLLVAYPLHPPGRPDRLRVDHFGDVDVPVLMLSGDADPFLTEDLLAAHAGDLAGPLTRLVVPGGVHDLSVSGRRAPDGRRRDPADAVAEQADALVAWAGAR